MDAKSIGKRAIPPGVPVFDVDGQPVGRAAGVEDDCLVVEQGEVFQDHVPLAAVVTFDGQVVRLGVTLDEVHRGEAERICGHRVRDA